MDERDQQSRERADRGTAIIAAAIIGAAFIISWGMSRSEPRYQLAASGDTVVRMDTDSGELIACNRQRCARVEPPDRAKTFGPLTVQFDSKPENALPAPTAETNKTP
jgi:hypothetical protein